ncbi:hypothetical protein DXV76_15835 [Rhodobacteraceae bacterium CCMM004]|nr:hypothetical protein DXV76_15835 [Rhodobacteraceae bacterium CCMM004]
MIGADGATGREVVAQAAARGHRVRALERSWPEGAAPLPPGVERATADVLEGDLAPAFAGCDAVVSAIGLGLSPQTVLAPPPLYTEGALNILRGMQTAEVGRLVVISASFVATRARGPMWFRLASGLALERVFTQMGEMERVLRASDGIDWTAVRPGWLMDGPLTADYTVAADAIPPGMIRTRHADLAHFIVDCVETGGWVRQTPAIARREPPWASTPDKLLAELLR